MKKRKILVIGYGGTISMVVKENKVVPAENIGEIMALLPSLSELADVDFDVLSNKDSTNVNHADWSRIAYHIAEKMDQYDGFLITHGTNTMAYTASALSLALGRGLAKPVALTGSQLPLTVYGNDARFNFENSIKVLVQACEENIAEVMIVFDDLVLRGGRAVKVSESAFRAFMSPAFPSIADITSTGVHFNYHARQKPRDMPFDIKPHFTPGILSIDLTPGQLPDLFETIISSGKCKGIILKSHGAGSVPTEGSYNFIPLIEKTVHQYKIPVIISTKFLGGNSFKEINDECAVLALEAGAIPSGDLTDVMTEVKLMWILSQGVSGISDIRRSILSEYAGEITGDKVKSLSSA
jgi:L-asparaginase